MQLPLLHRFLYSEHMRRLIDSGFALLAAGVLLCGCQSGPRTDKGRDGITYTRAIHDIGVWTSEDFDIQKIDSISVAAAKSEVPMQTKKEEIEQFERLKRALSDRLAAALAAKGFEAGVQRREATTPSGFVLEPYIIDYYPGSPGLRFIIGFGAGFPSITVRGILKDEASEKVLFRFETQREFEPRPFEYGDEQILQSDVKDLAVDIADYLDRLKRGTLK